MRFIRKMILRKKVEKSIIWLNKTAIDAIGKDNDWHEIEMTIKFTSKFDTSSDFAKITDKNLNTGEKSFCKMGISDLKIYQ